jgi:hypothetical protein
MDISTAYFLGTIHPTLSTGKAAASVIPLFSE